MVFKTQGSDVTFIQFAAARCKRPAGQLCEWWKVLLSPLKCCGCWSTMCIDFYYVYYVWYICTIFAYYRNSVPFLEGLKLCSLSLPSGGSLLKGLLGPEFLWYWHGWNLGCSWYLLLPKPLPWEEPPLKKLLGLELKRCASQYSYGIHSFFYLFLDPFSKEVESHLGEIGVLC